VKTTVTTCDRCGAVILERITVIHISGELRSRIERADFCATCTEAFVAFLRERERAEALALPN
jgi:hypothetical protein